ncbi:MAG: DUF3307 domain-containing protein [Ignavibacteriales bacterium]|nr:MAG: DUF3307 domain-containing protein [Ignavibacteriales bacterium]
MNNLFYQILFPVLSAHLLGDFILQTDKDVKNKANGFVFAKHVLIVTLLSYLLTGVWNSWILLFTVLFSHTIIDFIKRILGKDSLRIFLLDQLMHIIIAILLALYLQNILTAANISETFWFNYFGVDYLKLLVLLMAVLLITKISGIVISYIIKPYQIKTQTNPKEEIKNGRIIGYLERLIILVLFLSDLSSIIGFLIAAKSILRYSEIKNEKDKAMLEYVLIGTLLSFTIGIVIAAVTNKVLNSFA